MELSGKRILWGWIPATPTEPELVTAGWAGMMSLPRVLSLDTDGTLHMQFLPQLATLRVEPGIPGLSLTTETRATFSGGAGEALITGSTESEAFDLTVKTGFDEKPIMQLNYLPENRAMVIDGEKLEFSAPEAPHLHLYVDGSVVELVVNRQQSYTKRFYYDGTYAPDISLHTSTGRKIEDLKLTAWKIQLHFG